MASERKHPLLDIQDLTTCFELEEEKITAVDHISFQVNKGESVGIVGESGSGKSVTALTLLNLLPEPPGRRIGGRVFFHSDLFGYKDLSRLSEKEMRKIRGNEISMIFQEPMTSLNPVYTCGDQVMEQLLHHKDISREEAKRQVMDLFIKVRLPRPASIFGAYPHNLSGGQKQRVMIAMALSCNPKLIIADEPTTALDVTVQANILQLIKNLRQDYDSSVIFITHDLGVIAEVADRIIVMKSGRIVEQGKVWDVFSDPQHPYTKGLLACRPRLDLKLKVLPTVSDFMDETTGMEKDRKYRSVGEAIILNAERKEDLIERRMSVLKGGPILKVNGLKKYYPIRRNIFGGTTGYVKAVDDVSFEVYPGETIGLVGESGCGKTTLGRLVIRLIDPTGGDIFFEGRDVASLHKRELREMRKSMQIIFQDPYSSLNPRQTIGEAILEPMVIHRIHKTRADRKNAVFELLIKVGLNESFYNRYPHEFSGGQRQRICIARTLALEPRFIILDESVSALDVSVQAQILNLLNRLKKDFNLTYIFISHDLSVVKFMSDRIYVMKEGKFVEMGFPEDLYQKPREAYTRDLIDSIPRGDLEDIRKNMLRRRILDTARLLKDEIKSQHE